MSFQSAMRSAQKLNDSVQTLASIGASLVLASGARKSDPKIAACLDAVIDAFDADLLDDLSEEEAHVLYSSIRSFLGQALDMIENPGRPASWSFDDPAILQAQGRASLVLMNVIANFVASKPDFQERLARPGKFIDVGSGVGRISINAAERWPQLRVDGLDIFEPALTLAAENLAASAVSDRVIFHNADFADLKHENEYCVAFVAGPFIPLDAVEKGIPALHRAMEPGGWVFFALYRAEPDQLSQALLDLRVARSGGHTWTREGVGDLLTGAGMIEATEIATTSSSMLVAARKP